MEMAGKYSDHYRYRWQAKIVTTINIFFEKNESAYLEYLCNQRMDLSQILNLSLGDSTKIKNAWN